MTIDQTIAEIATILAKLEFLEQLEDRMREIYFDLADFRRQYEEPKNDYR